MTAPHRPEARPVRAGQAPVVAAVAAGGGLGAAARYAATLWWPTGPDGFPWTVLLVNVVGCAVIGAFMVAVTEVWSPHRLVRPFFGTGVLGGFTTFSTYAVDIRHLLGTGHPGTALAYLAATPLAALTAVWLAAAAARRALRGRHRLAPATGSKGGARA
ncbi:fluoride efflux transporter FluC [Streptomyces fumanus]|uniref:Fluoride-specific ion channel FluC n=1 Tax=Streptomyces fumanus TaxID=67302 RepID=A0A919ASK3_9ACTN|nr:CrcB family protein [Streptomyces fumanus]GHF22987.1 hypothetical protein GCM10018772_55820 [Streptomyces fumanus]